MGQGTEPADHECEQFAIRAYHFVGRDLSTPITRDEFTEFVKCQIGDDCTDLTTLAIAFERLDIPTAPPEPPAEEEAEVPVPEPEEEDAEGGEDGPFFARGPDDHASPARLLQSHAEAPASPLGSPVVAAAAAAASGARTRRHGRRRDRRGCATRRRPGRRGPDPRARRERSPRPVPARWLSTAFPMSDS